MAAQSDSSVTVRVPGSRQFVVYESHLDSELLPVVCRLGG